MLAVDFTHYPLADGTDAEILSWLDDHARFALHVSAYPRITGKIVLACLPADLPPVRRSGFTSTDSGMVYTVRFATGRGGITPVEAELRALGIVQKNSRPNHPTTCGKVERFQQTLRKWLHAQPAQPATVGELQHPLDAFVDEYNHRRPHRSLPHSATPAATYAARPKAAASGTPRSRTHDRVHHDKIDNDGKLTLRVNGRLHHIGMGRTLGRTPVILLVQDLHVRVVHAAHRRTPPPTPHQPQPRLPTTGKTRYPARERKKTEP